MASEQTIRKSSQQSLNTERTTGTIVAASYREDGWEIEVENLNGIRLSYWVGGARSAPSVGSTVHFYHDLADRRMCSIEIDGQRLFDSCIV